MSQNQTEYGKTITFTKLAQYVFGTYCMPKIMRDYKKMDPMKETVDNLDDMFELETKEKNEAWVNWNQAPTEETANALLEEIADQINILLFEAGQIAGFKHMKRE